MSREDQNKATFLALFKAMKARDSQAIAAQMTDRPNWIVWGNELPGIEGIIEILKAASGYYRPETIVHDIKGLWCDGDTMIARMTMTAKTTTNKDYANEYIWIARFENDKIAEVREYLDLRVIEQLFGQWATH